MTEKRQRPNPLTRLIRVFFHKNPQDYESPFESVLAGVAICVFVGLMVVLLGMLGAVFS